MNDEIPFAVTEISADARRGAAEVLASGWVTTGAVCARFEEEFAELVQAPHALAVSSCTAAIELALRALRLPAGAPVLTSTMTFCGAVSAIVHAGLQPVLVDVDPETLAPCSSTVRRAVVRHGPPAAMVVVHHAGHPAPVAALARAAGLPLDLVVEDAAHALWSTVGQQPVGSISRATCFSFYATKNLPIGEGGMLTTADSELAATVRRTRLHGMSRDAWRRYLPGGSWRYEVVDDGLKANMTDLQAAIGRGQLRHLERWQRRREDIAARYRAGLSGIAGLHLPPVAGASEGRHAWHLFVVRVTMPFPCDRDALAARLQQRGIGTSVHFIPIHNHEHFAKICGPVLDELPFADAVWPTILSLPLHPGLTDEQVDRVCREIRGIASGAACMSPASSSRPQEHSDVAAVSSPSA